MHNLAAHGVTVCPGWAQQLAVTQLLGQYCLLRCCQLLACKALFDVWHLLAALLYSVICALYFSCLCMCCVSVSWIWWRQWRALVLFHSLLAREYLSRFTALKNVCLECEVTNLNLGQDRHCCYLSRAFCNPLLNAKGWNFAHHIQWLKTVAPVRQLCILKVWGLGFLLEMHLNLFWARAPLSWEYVFFLGFFLKKTEKEGLLKMILKYKKYKPTVMF